MRIEYYDENQTFLDRARLPSPPIPGDVVICGETIRRVVGRVWLAGEGGAEAVALVSLGPKVERPS